MNAMDDPGAIARGIAALVKARGEAAPFDPVAAGIMVPRSAEVKKRTRDKSRIDESEGGDATLRGLAAKAREKQIAKEQAAAAIQQKKDEREAKRAQLELEAEERRQLYLNCKPKCTCGLDPCPMAGLVLCGTCGDIKKNVCRKAACVAAAAPLALTMAPEAAQPAPLVLAQGATAGLPVALATAVGPAQ